MKKYICSNIPSKKIIQDYTSREYKKFKKRYSEPINANETSNNTILSQNVQLSMNVQKTHLNNNVLVVENGKQSDIVKQNILQANSNFVVVDPEGELLNSTKSILEKQGYTIKTINFINPETSDHYNPFQYFSNEYDAYELMENLLQDVKSDEYTEPFWKDAKKVLLQAVLFYLVNYGDKKEKQLSSVIKLLYDSLLNEGNPDKKTKLDIIYETIGTKNPDDLGYKAYLKFKRCGDVKIRYFVINDCLHQLAFLRTSEAEQITNNDTLDLITFGDTKQAIFIIIPQNNNMYKPLITILYSQMYNIFYNHVVAMHSKHYAFKTRFFFNDFQNIGKICRFRHMIAASWIYDMSYFFVVHDIKDVKQLYEKKDAADIIGNCDSVVFYDNDEILLKYNECFVLLRQTQIFIDNIIEKRKPQG